MTRCVLASTASNFPQQHHVHGERDIDESQHSEDDIAQIFDSRLVQLWDSKRSLDNLLPSPACVQKEEDSGTNVDGRPNRKTLRVCGQEPIELQLVDVTYWHSFHRCVTGPKQLQLHDASEVNQIWWWSQKEVLGVPKTELQQMHRHKRQEHNSGDRQIEFTRADSLAQLHVPSPLQANESVQQDAQQNVLFHNICWQTETSPVQSDIEVTVSVEVVWTFEDMEISDSMNNNEQNKEDS